MVTGPFGGPRPFAEEGEKARYWIIVSPTGSWTGTNRDELSRSQQQEINKNAENLWFQDGRGQVFIDTGGTPKIFIRTIWTRRTAVPVNDINSEISKVFSGMILSDFEAENLAIHFSEPDKINKIIGPNVPRFYTRADDK